MKSPFVVRLSNHPNGRGYPPSVLAIKPSLVAALHPPFALSMSKEMNALTSAPPVIPALSRNLRFMESPFVVRLSNHPNGRGHPPFVVRLSNHPNGPKSQLTNKQEPQP